MDGHSICPGYRKLVFVCWGVLTEACPEQDLPSWLTGLPAGRIWPSPSHLSTIGLPTNYPSVLECSKSFPSVPSSIHARKRTGTACRCAKFPPPYSSVCPPPRRPNATWSASRWPVSPWHARQSSGSPSVRQWTTQNPSGNPRPLRLHTQGGYLSIFILKWLMQN